jgi:hypothetical protein
MTKIRQIGTHHEAIDRVAGLIGYANAAHHIGKSESYIRQCGDPDCARELHAIDAARLDQVCKAEYGEAPFEEWLKRHNAQVTWSGPRVDLRDAAFDLTVAQGKLCEAIRAAKSPTGPGGNRITDGERLLVLKEVRRQQRGLESIIQELTAQADTNNVIGITG